ncbi:PAS domain-containing protein [Polyangium sp. 6x1]|uniref:PAS domain-containing protein n=1 Tax=Polyangium sp. 6x1 TaxID=3042689 RepID=UPI0024825009|nr:PAS domain-containing protein [Polyangium sp. 6x1]MDI1447344.1 PAS domain-containing protein [Polyangium sp. 6x1]
MTEKSPDGTLTYTRIVRLLNAGRVVLYAATPEFLCTYISDNVVAQFGYRVEDFLRDPNFWTDRLHPDDAPKVLADLGGSFEDGHQTHEYRFRHGNGQWRWVYDEIVLVKDDEGRPVEFVGAWQDVTERKEAERLVQEQAAALAQFSTPLVPITDDVLVMPLVGSLDTRRAAQVIETLLDGVGKTQARVAILDITGVAVVDTQVADALLRAAKAVSLLGAQVVITGIRSEVAQTLVQLGANMGDVVTRATLQAGVAYAMRGRAWAGAEAKAGERPRPSR